MPWYRVYGKVTGSKYLGVFEAASQEEALEKAYASAGGHVGFCHQCSAQCEGAEVEPNSAEEIEESTSKPKRGAKKP